MNCSNKHEYDFDDVSKNGYSRPSSYEAFF